MAFVDNRTYKEWAQDYKDEADRIQVKIDAVKLEKETAPPSKQAEYDFRIKTLTDMRKNCMEIYHELSRRKERAL
ncbi:MAG: hypothetical protein II059_01185 [Clostridia bacterium]|nr:hypothetical protein [Clostridia bacterium]